MPSQLTNARLSKDVDGVIARAQEAGVRRQLIIATNEQEAERAIALCERYLNNFTQPLVFILSAGLATTISISWRCWQSPGGGRW